MKRTVVLATVLSLLSAGALAESKKRKAARLKKQAYKHVREGNYEAGVQAFEKAFEAHPHPGLALNIALTYDQWAGHCVEAQKAFERFLAVCPKCKQRKVGEKRFENMKTRCNVKVTIDTAPEGATVHIDGDSRGVAPLSLTLPPGTYQVVAKQDGHHDKAETLVVKEGTPSSITLELASKAPSPPPEPTAKVEAPVTFEDPVAPPAVWPVYVAGGVTVAAVAVGAIFGAQASGSQSTANDPAPLHPADRAQAGDDARSQAKTANIFYGVAGVAGAATVALYLWPILADDQPAGWIVAPSSATSLAFTGTF